MAKLIAPPQIGGLSELLDLVSDPNKFQAYTKQLMDYQAAINERLEMLNTKEAADEYLNAAKAKDAAADMRAANLQKLSEELAADRAAWRERLAKAKEALGF